jgi:hypothetical protein
LVSDFEEHRLRVFENRVLRWIIGPRSDEVTGEQRKPLNEELRDLYSSRSVNTRRMTKPKMFRWVAHVARGGEEERV